MTASAPTRSVRPVLVLTGFLLLVFCTGTAEYLAAGLLPQLSRDMDVTEAMAGQTVTAYALGVAIGGPLVTIATARLPRKGLALGLGAVFIAGTSLTAFAPSFELLMAGRVIAASSQATLFAIGLMTATTALGEGRAGRAVAIVTSGLTVATVMGVPLGAWLGGQAGWRMPFGLVAAIAILGVLLIAASMPRNAAPSTGVRQEITTLLRWPVLLAVGTTVVGFAGVGIVFTYLVPLLTGVTGLEEGIVPTLLFAYGIGGLIGNLAAGRLADISLPATLIGVLIALLVVLGVYPLVATTPGLMIAGVLGLGLLSTATIAPLQVLLLRHASAAPSLSLAVNVGAFNLANAIGAAIGGIGLSAGLLRFNGWIGAAFALTGLILAVLALRQPVATASKPDNDKENTP